MVTKDRRAESISNKLIYGAVFMVLLPALLIVWSVLLDKSIKLPVPDIPLVAFSTFIIGVFLISKGMFDLISYGRGLPMSAFPPKKFVSQGIYHWFSHPIYLGSGLFSMSLSLVFKSSSGFYLVTPVFIIAMISYVCGYERLLNRKIFGNDLLQHNAVFAFPRALSIKVSWQKKIATTINIFSSWLFGWYAIDYVRCGHLCIDKKELLNLVYLLPFIYLVVDITITKTEKALRKLAIAGFVAINMFIYFYALLPAFGIHMVYPVNLLVGFFCVYFGYHYQFSWSALQRFTGIVANSRKDWVFFEGRFRIINHSIFSGLAGAVGVGIAAVIMNHGPSALMLVIFVMAGATLFAQLLWGSAALLRPFGYWGAILGGMIGILVVYLLFRLSPSKIFLASVLCAPFAQAIGRFRCLSQGCCHGVLANKETGIRVWQEQSRVVQISGLRGKYILNTQLYSIIFNILLGFFLFAMWKAGYFADTLIIGLYLILTGIERFSEDAYRGEKQTRHLYGLVENQWLAIVALLVGILTTIIPGKPTDIGMAGFDQIIIIATIAGGLITAFAMSVDFPKSKVRFSRLSG